MENLYNKKIEVDSRKALQWVERTGVEMFGSKFKLSQDDFEILFKLMIYFAKDENKAIKSALDLEKGILLSGPIGCGKTSLMHIFNYFLSNKPRYLIKSTRDISYEFYEKGFTVVEKYGIQSHSQGYNSIKKPIIYCFDDLGSEKNIKLYGNDSNVMEEILQSRYELFHFEGIRTHATSNLNSNELEEMYGSRVRSRLRAMFNLISFPRTATDKRK